MIRSSLYILSAFLLSVPLALAEETPGKKPELALVDKIETYRGRAAKEPQTAMVNLETFLPGIDLDLKYATTDNFMGEVLYPVPGAFLRKPAAQALKKAQQEFARQGLILRVFDAYRPYSVTKQMWEKAGPSEYLADPAQGSRHNRGCAVDITLLSAKTGEALEMPTAYDDFTRRAHPDFEDLPENVLANRKLLLSVMDRHGFDVYETEWWHFDFRGWEKFDLMDISLEELTKELASGKQR